MLCNLFVIQLSPRPCFLHISIALIFALCIHSSGSLISSILSLPSVANHCLNGSALGDAIDCTILNAHLVLQQLSCWRPHLVFIQRGYDIFPHPLASSLSLPFISLIYVFTSLDSVRTKTISCIGKYRSSLCHIFLTSRFWNKEISNLVISVMSIDYKIKQPTLYSS